MTTDEIKALINEKDGSFDKAVCRSIFNEYNNPYEEFIKIAEESKSLDEFKDSCLENDRTRLTQGTYYLIRECFPDEEWYYRRGILGDKQVKLPSDIGSVKVGVGNTWFTVHNGMGDGTTRFAVLDKKDFNLYAFDYITQINGTFDIYNGDCSDSVLMTLTGSYTVWSADGFVVFVK